jgi:fatty acid desaturase
MGLPFGVLGVYSARVVEIWFAEERECRVLGVGMAVEIDQNSDYSRSFQRLRPRIKNSKGVRLDEFIKQMQPNYWRVYLDIVLGYAALIATATGLVSLLPATHGFVAIPAAISVGFWIAYLQMFIHEGAHFNFSADKDRSDLLCNVLISWVVGISVQQYRIVHFQHHRALGCSDDSEMSYFYPLNFLFLAKTMLGIRVLEVLASRHRSPSKPARSTKDGKNVGLIGLFMHGLMIVALYWFGGVWSCVVWIVGVGMMFPFFAALRQLLEHRDPQASPDVDYSLHDHGAYTRIFGSGPLSSIYGAAGFNRHLLHHWEPQVSYTNLPQLEAYLLDTDAGPLIEMRRSNYFKTFLGLFHLS